MKSILLLVAFLIASCLLIFLFQSTPFSSPIKTNGSTASSQPENIYQRIKAKGAKAVQYTKGKGYNTRYQFLIDMRLPSNRKRFFVYDALKDSITDAGLVAHGSCRSRYLENAQFSNIPNGGCSSIGKYKIGNVYQGRFGTAYKLHGLDSANSKAFVRNVVLHACDCVPDEETDASICNSLGCPMVSYNFLNRLSKIIKSSSKPVLLWVFE